MKELILTQSYSTINDMLNSEEVKEFVKELEQGNIDEYAVVSRIGNRYNLDGKRISKFAQNPYVTTSANISQVETENKKQGENTMKYTEIEALIDNEIAKAVADINAKHEQELAELKEKYTAELESAKATVKAEIIAKING